MSIDAYLFTGFFLLKEGLFFDIIQLNMAVIKVFLEFLGGLALLI